MAYLKTIALSLINRNPQKKRPVAVPPTEESLFIVRPRELSREEMAIRSLYALNAASRY